MTPTRHDYPATLSEIRRGPLRTTRDVVAIIRDVLLIVVLAALLLFGWSALRAAGDQVGRDDSPKTQQECQAKPPAAVWPSCDRYK